MAITRYMEKTSLLRWLTVPDKMWKRATFDDKLSDVKAYIYEAYWRVW